MDGVRRHDELTVAANSNAVAEALGGGMKPSSTGVDVLQAYGLTESTGAAIVRPWNRCRLGTVGVPIAGVSVAVLAPSGRSCEPGQEGEIALRGPTVTSG